jgi:galactokinase
VNLIGDHTDHTGGLVLPMAIDLATTVEGVRGGATVALRSGWSGDQAKIPLTVEDPARVRPQWARYVAAVVAELRAQPTSALQAVPDGLLEPEGAGPAQDLPRGADGGGFVGTVETTLPVGAGLSSSAALEVAVALALGFEGTPRELAQLCRRAEQTASGVPCGVMDQLASAAGIAGHALRIDCTTLEITPVRLPDEIDVIVAHSGETRSLAGSAYAERAAACQRAQAEIGPLRGATEADVERIVDPTVRRLARHVVRENALVDELIDALRHADHAAVSRVMAASHRSLRDDFEVSTPTVDALVQRLVATPGVIGARLTGAGFGGCVVALATAGTALPEGLRAWRVQAADAAHLER